MVGDQPRDDRQPAAANETASLTGTPPPSHDGPSGTPVSKKAQRALMIGAIGVVFGDIGTSPIYALREAVSHAQGLGDPRLAVMGVVSLAFWALMVVVTFKYVAFLMRAARGEPCH